MNVALLVLILIAGIGAIFMAVLFVSLLGGKGNVRSQLQSIISSQRKGDGGMHSTGGAQGNLY
ncbi:hypothetical protein OAO01_01740, partial [Oligoflexia bacterium]|nr:hypothetical protein [Oligoflexia bacterium]